MVICRPSLLAALLVAAASLVASLPARADCPPVEVVVDNDIPGSGYSEDKPHNWASRPTGACSGTYRYLSHDDAVAPNNDGTRTGKAIWQPTIPVSGNYEIVVSYRATTNRTHDADYFVYDDLGGVSHQVIDQAHSGDCTHVSLGVFPCQAGGQCRVELDGTDDSQSDSADVTTFTLVDCGEPPAPGACAGIAAVPSYEVCSESADSCAGTFVDGSGCIAYCAAAGMECVARYGGEPGCQQEATPIPCDANNGHLSDWCECALPPQPPPAAEGGGGSGPGGEGAGADGSTGGSGPADPGTGGFAAGGASAGGSALEANDANGSGALTGSCSVEDPPARSAPPGWLLLLAAAVLGRRRATG